MEKVDFNRLIPNGKRPFYDLKCDEDVLGLGKTNLFLLLLLAKKNKENAIKRFKELNFFRKLFVDESLFSKLRIKGDFLRDGTLISEILKYKKNTTFNICGWCYWASPIFKIENCKFNSFCRISQEIGKKENNNFFHKCDVGLSKRKADIILKKLRLTQVVIDNLEKKIVVLTYFESKCEVEKPILPFLRCTVKNYFSPKQKIALFSNNQFQFGEVKNSIPNNIIISLDSIGKNNKKMKIKVDDKCLILIDDFIFFKKNVDFLSFFLAEDKILIAVWKKIFFSLS